MKFCPYCGAELPDETIAFCAECGKALPEKEQQSEQEEKTPPKKKKKPKKTAKKKKQAAAPAEPETPVDDGYDGYYDDVLPEDINAVGQGIDKQLVKKVAALGISAMLIIAACVAIMYMLG